ncbi:DUF7455 domain-containing protein [Streptomyces cinereoruber]
MTAQDRCDRCGAQANIRAHFSHNRELLFCAHHGRRCQEALDVLSWEVVDG